MFQLLELSVKPVILPIGNVVVCDKLLISASVKNLPIYEVPLLINANRLVCVAELTSDKSVSCEAPPPEPYIVSK